MAADLACMIAAQGLTIWRIRAPIMRLHRTVIAIFALLILAHLIWHVISTSHRGWEWSFYSGHVVLLAFSAGYFLGWRWCRFAIGSIAWIFVPLLLSLPLAQHEVDRTFLFYSAWTIALMVFVVTAVTCFYKERSRDAVT